jgi:uncharacterized secreted protein with C-terminal beta-propeller domain
LRAFRPSFEVLEDRCLLDAALLYGVWTITGTPGDDQIVIDRDPQNQGTLRAFLNGQQIGSEQEANMVGIRVDAGDGNDSVKIDESNGAILLPATLLGGAGNDTLVAGSGRSWLYGGAGSDSLVGGAGDDVLVANGTLNTSTSATDQDTLDGGAGNNLLDSSGNQATMTNGKQITSPASFGSADAFRQYLIQTALTRYQDLFGKSFPGYNWGYPNGGFGGYVVDVPMAFQTAYTADATATGNSFSQTNVQVAGVDEGDIVKTDGTYIYEISRQGLVILKAWPANSMTVVSRTPIEGSPIALYLDGSRITVLSSIYAGTTVTDPLVRTPDGFPLVYPSYVKTKVTELDVTDPTAPQTVQATYFDGSYDTSRDINGIVYVVVQNSFTGLPAPAFTNFNGETIYESQDSYLARIAGHEFDLALPHFYVHQNPSDLTSPLVPEGFVSDPATIYQPLSANDYNLLTVMSFDTSSNATGPSATVSVMTSYASTVYASATHLYVLSPRWASDPAFPGTGTLVEQFNLQGTQVTLGATGWVPGQALSQFWVDESGPYLRIVTTQDWGLNATNSLYVLMAEGGTLSIVGSMEDLAHGLQMQGVRFMGDRAFLTTASTVDPLFTVDVSVPTWPRAIAELHIPGQFTYLQPLDATHLLGLGWSSPYHGVLLGLFDISDLSSPSEISSYTIAPAGWPWGTFSEAQWDHHALSYFPEYQELAIPIYGTYTSLNFTDYVSSLFVFQVDATNGFQLLGTINHDSQVRRSLRINNELYSIADDSVQAHPIQNPSLLDSEVRVYDDPRFPAGVMPALTVGESFSGAVLTFKVTDPTGLAATINWGDGQSSAGTIADDGLGDGRFTVSGSHTWTQGGYFDITISFTRNGQALTNLYTWVQILTVDLHTERFIKQIYQDVLHRDADVPAVQTWGGVLSQGTTRATVASDIVDSTETRYTAIENLYQQLLGRQAEATGLNGWLAYLGQGHTLADIETAILGSQEYFDHQGGTNTAFLKGLYAAVLNRGIDPAGADGWAQLLADGTDRATIAYDLLHSTEAFGNTVQGLYQTYLHRSADALGLQTFVNAMSHGMTADQVAAAIMASDEYFNRA